MSPCPRLAWPPAEIHDPLVQVIVAVKLAGFERPVLGHGQPEPPAICTYRKPIALDLEEDATDEEHGRGYPKALTSRANLRVKGPQYTMLCQPEQRGGSHA